MRYKCTVAYNGAQYCGWQSQRNGNSVQEIIEAALYDIAREKINILASGRTDAGVSAKGQVFHFDTERVMPARKWMGALNGRLPGDIHIMNVEEVSVLFHARYNVRMKQYDYLINLGPYDVFTKDIAYQCPVQLDIDKMIEASRYLIGTHDFTSFNSNPLSETPNQVRTVFDIVFHREGNLLRISYTGTGFLRYMVRMMSSQLIEVGKGKKEPLDVKKDLDACSKTIPRKNAPANGLTLVSVDYFRMIALSEQGMIREFLYEDHIPDDIVLSQAEKACREDTYPQWYALTGRHDQNIMGVLTIEENSASMQVMNEQGGMIWPSLKEQTEAYLAEKGIGKDAFSLTFEKNTKDC